jgi:hypothetical protein
VICIFTEADYLAAILKSAFEPCIPTGGTPVPDWPEWLHEIKQDMARFPTREPRVAGVLWLLQRHVSKCRGLSSSTDAGSQNWFAASWRYATGGRVRGGSIRRTRYVGR